MNENKNWKILQIIQAQSGWTAVHCQESKNHEIKVFNRPIVCWAVVEPIADAAAAQTQVRGIEQGPNELAVVEDFTAEQVITGADRNQYFLGYNDPDAHKESDYWIMRANERLRIEGKKKLDESIN